MYIVCAFIRSSCKGVDDGTVTNNVLSIGILPCKVGNKNLTGGRSWGLLDRSIKQVH